MTSLTFRRSLTAPAAAPVTGSARPAARAGRGSGRLSRVLPLGRTAVAPRAAARPVVLPTAGGCEARGSLRLTLQDGIARRYLLDFRDFATTTSPDVAFDARVRTAYQLALQGHAPQWIADQLSLPTGAAHDIAANAARSGPAGPGHLPSDV
ncbi:hypothetical protein [Kitasatospora sp. LaBMicrA B282]|uniref:hypothetical protein n=1 Tax=Kitasatospora sp. LaBMicrA B282 TaxID=3420949 RepID=UPI003D09BA2B